MTTTVTGTFESSTHIKNVEEELLAGGLPSEKIYTDKANSQIKVMVPDQTASEIEDIFKRHDATAVLDS